jgi:hypothetical protein
MRATEVASRIGKPHTHSADSANGDSANGDSANGDTNHGDANHGNTNRDRYDVDQHRRGHYLRPQRDWRQRQASGNAQCQSYDESCSVREGSKPSANSQPGIRHKDANTDDDRRYPDGQPIAVSTSAEVHQGRAIG